MHICVGGGGGRGEGGVESENSKPERAATAVKRTLNLDGVYAAVDLCTLRHQLNSAMKVIQLIFEKNEEQKKEPGRKSTTNDERVVTKGCQNKV